jgi:hypothetical protein
MFKHSLRELFLLLTIVALICGWSIDRLVMKRQYARLIAIERCYPLMVAILQSEGYTVQDDGGAKEPTIRAPWRSLESRGR